MLAPRAGLAVAVAAFAGGAAMSRASALRALQWIVDIAAEPGGADQRGPFKVVTDFCGVQLRKQLPYHRTQRFGVAVVGAKVVLDDNRPRVSRGIYERLGGVVEVC